MSCAGLFFTEEMFQSMIRGAKSAGLPTAKGVYLLLDMCAPLLRPTQAPSEQPSTTGARCPRAAPRR